MSNYVIRCLSLIILIALLLSGCANNQTTESESPDQPIAHEVDKFDEHIIEKVKENEQSELELNVYKTACVGEDDEQIDVSVCSVSVEKDRIATVSADKYQYFTLLYDNSLQENMALSSDYVFLSVDVKLKGDKSYDRLYVSSFRLYYTVDGSEYFEEMAYQSAVINPNNPHDTGVISYTAGEEKDITIGYIVPNQIVRSENICLLAAFASSEDDAEKSPMFKIADGTTFE